METDLELLEVRLMSNQDQQPMLGTFRLSNAAIEFIPVVPFTNGLTYKLLEAGKVFGEITIPISDSPAPELLAIFPTSDTVPENLLKVYLKFSAPMMEGRSASFVHLLKDERDTMKGTFLDLQPELWNEEGTILTLWLDPGRIKLDLIPNKELGNPLTRGTRYELVVGSGWRSKDGVPLKQSTNKTLVVGDRDDTSPDIDLWKLEFPALGTKQPLRVRFGESLDRMLAEETIRVLDARLRRVSGTQVLVDDDAAFEFVPDQPWSRGDYSLAVEGRLEDLSGNNLNRLFETNLTKPGNGKQPKETYVRSFSLQ